MPVEELWHRTGPMCKVWFIFMHVKAGFFIGRRRIQTLTNTGAAVVWAAVAMLLHLKYAHGLFLTEAAQSRSSRQEVRHRNGAYLPMVEAQKSRKSDRINKTAKCSTSEMLQVGYGAVQRTEQNHFADTIIQVNKDRKFEESMILFWQFCFQPCLLCITVWRH